MVYKAIADCCVFGSAILRSMTMCRPGASTARGASRKPGAVKVGSASVALKSTRVPESNQKRKEADIAMAGEGQPNGLPGTNDPPVAQSTLPMVDQLYSKMVDLFGNPDQTFLMEWPGRVLDMSTYKYPVTDAFSSMQKPQTVIEAEFKLTDALFDPPYPGDRSNNYVGSTAICGGPNGKYLSTAFDAALNSIVPNVMPPTAGDVGKIPNIGAFVKDQGVIREWLMKKVPDVPDLEPFMVPDDFMNPDDTTSANILKIPTKKKAPTNGILGPLPNGATNGALIPAKTDGTATKLQTDMGAPPSELTRMDLYLKLNSRYEMKKAAWEAEKDSRLKQAIATHDPQKLEDYARFIAHEAPVRDAEIAAHYSNLVVRGYYHIVKAQLGFLNVETQAERLDRLKQNMLNTSMGSQNEGQTIYPVSMQPEDWFAALDTDFAPMDLLEDPALLRPRLAQLQSEMDDLTLQYAQFSANKTGNIAQLQDELNSKQDALDQANSSMQSQFSSNVLDLVAMYYAHQNAKSNAAKKDSKDDPDKDPKKDSDEISKAIGKDLGGGQQGPTPEEVQKIKEMQDKAIKAEADLASAARKLSQAQIALAEAKATDPTGPLIVLQNRINGKQRDIDEIKNLLCSSNPDDLAITKRAIDGDPLTDQESADLPIKSLLPSKQAAAVSASRFMDVVLHSTRQANANKSSLESQASQTQGGGSFLFCGGGWSESSSSATDLQSMEAAGATYDIGFRATKVTVDRSGWFDTTVLSNTQSMNKITGDTISNGKPNKAADAELCRQTLLPCYPVSFVVAKDVTIKITSDASKSDSAHKVLDKASSWNVGFFCFSCSHSESSHSDSKSFYSSSSGNSYIIKIPGPQIIGWFLEWTDKDVSSPYNQRMNLDWIPDPPTQTMLALNGTAPDKEEEDWA